MLHAALAAIATMLLPAAAFPLDADADITLIDAAATPYEICPYMPLDARRSMARSKSADSSKSTARAYAIYVISRCRLMRCLLPLRLLPRYYAMFRASPYAMLLIFITSSFFTLINND